MWFPSESKLIELRDANGRESPCPLMAPLTLTPNSQLRVVGFGHVTIIVRGLVGGETAIHLVPCSVKWPPHKTQRLKAGEALGLERAHPLSLVVAPTAQLRVI